MAANAISAYVKQVTQVNPAAPQTQHRAQAPKAAVPTGGRDSVTISPQARAMALNLQGMTVQEIAQALQIDVKTVEAYLSIRTRQTVQA